MLKTSNKHLDFLFSEFANSSSQEWKQNIQVELKGADYNQKLVWESLEGIKVKPFYQHDSAEYIDIPDLPEKFYITQSFFIDNEEIVNSLIKNALIDGAQVIYLTSNKPFDIDVLLQDISPDRVEKIIFNLEFLESEFIQTLQNNCLSYPIKILLDPIHLFSRKGNWLKSEKDDLSILDVLLTKNHTVSLSVHVDLYQNAGANTVQQIAYSLAHALEYVNGLKHLMDKSISFKFAIGSNYFFEIAKLRAFRYLWNLISSELGLHIPCEIESIPTVRNKSFLDYNVNILRATTEQLSAILGGANYVHTWAYDSFFKKSNRFSERIARNQLIILREENAIANHADIAKGSYYIEALTLELAQKSLDLFKNIEASGGFLFQLKSGKIQQKIKESANKEQSLFDTGELILLGVNKFINTTDQVDFFEINPFISKNNSQTLIEPIVASRLAEGVEQE